MTHFVDTGFTDTYYVWPKNGIGQSGYKTILTSLTSITGLTLDDIMVSQLGTDFSDVNFFTVNMKEDAAFMVANVSEVLTVTLKGTGAAAVYLDLSQTEDDLTGNATIHNKRDDPYTIDIDQEPETVYVSQPRNVVGGPLLRLLGGKYVYPKSAGKGSIFYMIDSGADETNPEFDNIRPSWRWAGPSYDRNANQGEYPEPIIGDDPQKPHGTWVLSKGAGAAYGVAKYPYVIIVRRPLMNYIDDAIDQITWIIEDWLSIREVVRVKVAVINMSWGFLFKELRPEDKLKLPRFESIFVRAIQEGLLPILAAGNDPGRVASYPALFPSPFDWNGVPRPPPAYSIMVIGSTNNAGRVSSQSCTAPWVQLTAPGVDITTADYHKGPGVSSGTSLASPQIAGLGTVLAAEGDYGSVQGSWQAGVNQLRQAIMFLSYSRSPVTPVNLVNYPLGIWNGVLEVNGVCGTWVPPTQKRDATPDECSINASPTSSSVIATQTSIASSPATVSSGQIFTNVTVAPSSVILGFNKTSLLTTIVSQLSEMCDPANFTCTEYGEIDNVYSYFANMVTKGTLKIKIPESGYKTRTQRDGLILRAGQAMSGSGSNCATYEKEIGNCPRRRAVGWDTPCEVTYVDVCHYTDSVDVVVFQDEVGLIAQTQIEFSFDFAGEALLCEEIVAAIDVDTFLAALFPEIAATLVEIREALGEEEAWCNDVNELLTQASTEAQRMRL